MKKNILRKLILSIPMVCLLLPSIQNVSTGNEMVQNHIPIKKVNSGVDENGHQYQTFSYTVYPLDFTDKRMIVNLDWDGNVSEDINEYLKVDHDEVNCTVKVTLLKKANTRAVVSVEHFYTGVSGYVYIDFYKDHLGWKNEQYSYNYPLSIKNNDKFLSTEMLIEEIKKQSLGLGPGTVYKDELQMEIIDITSEYDWSINFFEIVDNELILQQENMWFMNFQNEISNLEDDVETFSGQPSLDLFNKHDIFDRFENQDNEIKRIIRSYSYLGFFNRYKVQFDYYDLKDVTHYVDIAQYFPVSEIIEHIDIFPTQIDISIPNIIF